MHVIFWLGLLAALVCNEFAPADAVSRPFVRAAASIALAAGLGSWALRNSRRACRRLTRRDSQKGGMSEQLRQQRVIFTGLWLTLTALVLGPLQWPQITRDCFGLARCFLIDEIVVVLPIAAPLLGWWRGQQQLEKSLSDALGTVAAPKRPRRVSRQLQSAGLPLVMPVVAVVATRDACTMSGIADHAPWFECGAVAVVLALTAVAFPLWIRYVCGTSRLVRQPLRGRLIRAGQQYHIGDYLIWNAHQSPMAAVTGTVPGLRYILLSNPLVNGCSDEEIEAIVAHELGHVYHRHVLLRLGVVAAPLAVLAGPLSAESLAGATGGYLSASSHAALPLILTGCAAYTIGVVRPYWRLLEHQADGFALWRGTVADAAEDSSGKKEGPELSVYLRALEKLKTAGSKQSWPAPFHPDLAQRRMFLRRTACHPRRFDEFTRRMRLLNGLLVTTLLAAVAAAALTAGTS